MQISYTFCENFELGGTWIVMRQIFLIMYRNQTEIKSRTQLKVGYVFVLFFFVGASIAPTKLHPA